MGRAMEAGTKCFMKLLSFLFPVWVALTKACLDFWWLSFLSLLQGMLPVHTTWTVISVHCSELSRLIHVSSLVAMFQPQPRTPPVLFYLSSKQHLNLHHAYDQTQSCPHFTFPSKLLLRMVLIFFPIYSPESWYLWLFLFFTYYSHLIHYNFSLMRH